MFAKSGVNLELFGSFNWVTGSTVGLSGLIPVQSLDGLIEQTGPEVQPVNSWTSWTGPVFKTLEKMKIIFLEKSKFKSGF